MPNLEKSKLATLELHEYIVFVKTSYNCAPRFQVGIRCDRRRHGEDNVVLLCQVWKDEEREYFDAEGKGRDNGASGVELIHRGMLPDVEAVSKAIAYDIEQRNVRSISILPHDKKHFNEEVAELISKWGVNVRYAL